jgi:hypothetical protein
MSDLPTREAAKALEQNWTHWGHPLGHSGRIVKAYAVGRLIDGQAIADAWNGLGALGQARVASHAINLTNAIEDALTEEDSE